MSPTTAGRGNLSIPAVGAATDRARTMPKEGAMDVFGAPLSGNCCARHSSQGTNQLHLSGVGEQAVATARGSRDRLGSAIPHRGLPPHLTTTTGGSPAVSSTTVGTGVRPHQPTIGPGTIWHCDRKEFRKIIRKNHRLFTELFFDSPSSLRSNSEPALILPNAMSRGRR